MKKYMFHSLHAECRVNIINSKCLFNNMYFWFPNLDAKGEVYTYDCINVYYIPSPSAPPNMDSAEEYLA